VQRYFLIATVADRMPMLRRALETLAAHVPGWQLVLVTQGLSDADIAEVEALAPGVVLRRHTERLGMHNARLDGLRCIEELAGGAPYVVCSADDDEEFLPETNLDPCVAKAWERGVGLVSSGWIPSEGHRRIRPVVDVFVKQNIVYTGGGLVFSSPVARILRAIPEGRYFSDNMEWALAVYLAGYDNFRYRGSLAIHRACSTGGRKAWVTAEERQVSDPRYITTRPGAASNRRKSNHLIGTSADLTPAAHELHRRNRALLLG
jgi:Glycosyl transferase family 2